MKHRFMIIALVLTFAGTYAGAVTYTGSLSSADLEIVGTGGWISPGPTEFDFTVTDEDPNNGYPLKYAYQITLPEDSKDISHIILEVSVDPEFTENNLYGVQGATEWEIKLNDTNPGSPELPENIFSIKFEGLPEYEEGPKVYDLVFWSDRSPVWGDFYMKAGSEQGGNLNVAYNAGFIDPNNDDDDLDDTDPQLPPDSQTVDDHILVPNGTFIPEPGTATLLLVGMAGILLRKRT